MCGIAGIHVKERAIGRFPVDRLVDYLLLGIEPRGDHATGLVAVSGEKMRISLEKKDDPASKFVLYRKGIPADTRTVLLHTRWATQGKPEDNRNNHPVMHGTCFAVHNGHINNDSELFAEMGVERHAEVDSIAIPACLTYHGISELDDIKAGLEMLKGGFATAVIDPIAHPGRLILAKGISSPLVVINHPDAIVWASTLIALKYAWGHVLGTPPSRFATPNNPRGIYDFKYGDLWVIDGDVIKRERFQPAPMYSSSGSGNFNRFQGDYDDDYWDLIYGEGSESEYDSRYAGLALEDDPNWERTPAGGWRFIGNRYERGLAATGGRVRVPRVSSTVNGTKRTWTCEPASWECIHPCTSGCSTMRCECYEENPDHPTTPGNVIDIRRNVGDREATVVQAECYSCQDDYDLKELRKFRCEDGEEVFICQECGEWEAIESEVNVLKEHDSRVQKLTQYERVAQKENTIHTWACKEVAFELGCTAEFVQWILFEASDEELEDSWLGNMRASIDDEYINAIEIVKATRELDNASRE